MSDQLFTFLSQLAATIIGGGLVILANYLTHRHERRVEEEKQQDRNSALFTAVFSVRNFVTEAMNELAETNDLQLAGASLKTALSNIQSIIEKSPPDTQYVMSSVYGISLALGELVALIEVPNFTAEQLGKRVDRLEEAIDFFDLVAPQDLTLMTDEEIASLVENPEDVLDNRHSPEECDDSNDKALKGDKSAR